MEKIINGVKLDNTNPVINNMLTGGIKPNPNYNPKTKKGRAEPKYIKDTEPKDFTKGMFNNSVESNRNLGYHPEDLGLTDEEYKDYTNDGIIPSPYKTQEDLTVMRADKQSALEQFGNTVVQGVTNEIVLGTLLGFSNLADFAINFFTKEGEDDYTNPVSEALEGWQDNIRKKFAIYQRNPNESWDASDFGWWMNNSVSVLSSASMLIPTIGTTKALSFLGRATRAGRAISKGLNKTSKAFARGINKMSRPITGSNKIGRIQKSISNGTELAGNAFLSRTMENYLEARGVYKEVYDDTLQRIKDPNFNREEFFKLNPDLEGKDDEELAAHIASISADETFQNDYAMLAMDIVQFKALKNLWKGKVKNNESWSVSEFNRRVASNIGKKTTDNATKVTFKDRLNYIKHNPSKATWDAIKSIEFTEGFEEGYQGIQIEKGKEVAEKIFNPNFRERSIEDYITDDKISEQAFWGILGGVGFKHIGNGFGRLVTEADILTNKKFAKEDKRYTQKQIDLMRQGVEKQQVEEILGREKRIRQFNNQLDNLERTHTSNYQTLKDNNGKDIVDENGNKIYKELTDEEVQQERQDLIDAFITDMTIDAALAGNYELLREYVKSPEVRKLLDESSSDRLIEESFLKQMDDIYDKYSNNIYNVWNSLDVVNDYIGHKVARDITLDQIRLEQTQDHLDEIKSKIAEVNNNNVDVQAYLDKVRREILGDIYNDKTVNRNGINYLLENIDAHVEHIEREYANNNITEQAYRQYMRDINTERKGLLNYAKTHLKLDFLNNLDYTTASRQLKEWLNNFTDTQQNENIPDSLKKLLREQAYTEFEIENRFAQLPVDQDQIKDAYDTVNLQMNEYTQMAYALSTAEVRSWLKKQKNLNDAAQQLANNTVEELKEALDILKMGHYSTNQFIGSIKEEIQKETKRRENQANENAKVRVDGQETTGVEAAKTEELLDNADISTGESTETEITETTTPTESTNNNQPGTNTVTVTDDLGQTTKVSIIDEEDVSDIEQQAKEDAAKADENFELSNDALAASTASNIIMEMTRQDKSIVDIFRRGINTKEFNDLLDKIADELILRGVTPEYAKDYARQGMVVYSNLLHKVFNDEYFLHLAAKIATNSDLKGNNFASSTKFLGQADLNEAIEEFITEYCKQKGIPLREDGRTIINTRQLLKDIIENKNIDIETAKYIIRNLRDYLASNRSKKFVFDNRNIIYRLRNTIEGVIQDIKTNRIDNVIIDGNLHINLPTRAEKRSAAKKKLLESKGKGKLTFAIERRDDGVQMKSIAIKLDGVEIGFLAKVTNDANGTNLRLLSPQIGFAYSFNITNSNNLQEIPTSNLDDFFDQVINQKGDGKEIFDIVYKYHRSLISPTEKFTIEELTALVNNKLIQSLLDKNNKRLYIKNSNIYDDANVILKHLDSIIFYSDDIYTDEDRMLSFGIWKRKMYDNYKQTQYIQELMDKNINPTGSISQVTIKNNNYAPNVRNNVSAMGFKYETNPIVYFTDSTTIIDDNGGTYNNNGNFRVGGAGILIGQQGVGVNKVPIIASIVDTINVEDSTFNEPLRNEFIKLIIDFSSGNLSFTTLSKKLSNLFGGVIDGKGQKGNHLFAGLRVIQKAGKLGIVNASGKVVVMFYRDRIGTTNAGTGITHFNNKYANGKQTFIVPNNNIILDIVNELMPDVKFNINYIMAKARNTSDFKENDYFSKQNGKFVITLPGAEKTYDSYTQFILDNKIAITNQKLNPDGSIFNESDVVGVEIEAIGKDISQLPVEEDTTSSSALNILKNATEETPGSTVNLLQAVGYSNEIIDIMLGRTDNIPSLIPTTFIFNSELQEQGLYNESTNTITIGNGTINEINGAKRRTFRVLAHERLHQLLNEKSVFSQANIVRDLLNTYNEAISYAKSLTSKDSNYELAQKFLKWIEDEKFNPTDYAANLSDKVTGNITPERRFAEEWLVESLTMPGIAEFLNTAYSKKGNLDDTNKSIWQKIIETLLKILGVKSSNINNMTILAEHYKLLANADNITTTENIVDDTKEENKKANEESSVSSTADTKIGDSINNEDLNSDISIKDIEDAADDFEVDESLFTDNSEWASTNSYFEGTMSPTTEHSFDNIEEYINTYPEQDRENIRKLIDKNGFNFKCYV